MHRGVILSANCRFPTVFTCRRTDPSLSAARMLRMTEIVGVVVNLYCDGVRCCWGTV